MSVSEGVHGLLALSVLFLVSSQTLRLVQRHPSLGPHVVMMIHMLHDMLRFLTLIAGPLLGFAAAFSVILHGSVSQPCVKKGLSQSQTEQDPAGLWGWTLALIEIMLGGDDMLQCLHEHHHSGGSWILMYGFLAFMILLSLNMLIAMMAQTYQILIDESVRIHMHIRALSTLTWLQARAVPPPLLPLSLPYYILKPMIKLAAPSLYNYCTSALYSRLIDDAVPSVAPSLAKQMSTADAALAPSQDELRQAIDASFGSEDDLDEISTKERLGTLESKMDTLTLSLQQRLPPSVQHSPSDSSQYYSGRFSPELSPSWRMKRGVGVLGSGSVNFSNVHA